MKPLDPIVLQSPLSDQQKRTIQAQGDIAVTAGAGAGKTRTLVARYLSLLANDLNPRQVVAITFTRKAAREMRNRVREQMQDYLETPELSRERHAYWQRLYDELDAARIGTIHSLCGEILRHHPAHTGIDPQAEPLSEGHMALLQAQAITETLAWAADQQQAVPLFAYLGEGKLQGLLSTMLQQRLDTQETLANLPQEKAALSQYWEDVVANRRAEAMSSLVQDPDFVQALDDVRQANPLDPRDKLVIQWQQVVDALGQTGLPGIDDLQTVASVKLNMGSYKAWAGGKAELADVKGALGTLRDKRKEQAQWLTLELTPVDRDLIEHYAAIRSLFDYANARYVQLKRERPALDFDDLEIGAVRLLEQHPSIRAYWQDQTRALLVDEFQDTNDRQRRLLDLLNGDEGKLFIVGDGKQSIYRFRGADVTVFRQKRQEIELNGQAFDLPTSYRAHRGLVDGLNALLEPALGKKPDPARPFVEPFAPLEAHRKTPTAGLESPFIELHLARGAKGAGALDRAAQATVSRIVNLVQSQRISIRDGAADGGQRPLNYGDVAILCRATSSFPAYENALDAAGVPFLTVAGRGFYDRPEVRDVLNALQALATPTDDAALAGLLRSPGCGLSDMALYRLVQAREAQSAASLWQVLCSDALGFLESEAGLAQTAQSLAERLHERVGRQPVADVLKAFLDATEYQTALMRSNQHRGARNLGKLLSDAHASEIVRVGDFLDYVQQLRDVGTREGEAHTISTGSVQIMSVHAAKGLEFPIVILGDAGRRPPRASGVFIDPAIGVVPPAQQSEITEDPTGRPEAQSIDSSLYRLARHAATELDEAEFARLLYVAATRTQEMLIISAAEGNHLDGWLKQLDSVLEIAAGLKEHADAECPYTLEREAGGQPVAYTVYPTECEIPLVVASIEERVRPELPRDLPLLRSLTPEPLMTDEQTERDLQDPAPRVWRVVPPEKRVWAPSWVVGQIVHTALQEWRFPATSSTDFDRWAAIQARGCGIVDDGELRNAIDRARQTLVRFQATPLYVQMDAAAQRLHEVPYCVLDGDERLERGIIDALFRDETGWTLVEFKTDRLEDQAALEKKLQDEDYVPQVARYLSAAQRMLGKRPKPILCLLDMNRTVHLVTDRWPSDL